MNLFNQKVSVTLGAYPLDAHLREHHGCSGTMGSVPLEKWPEHHEGHHKDGDGPDVVTSEHYHPTVEEGETVEADASSGL